MPTYVVTWTSLVEARDEEAALELALNALDLVEAADLDVIEEEAESCPVQ